MADGEYYKSDFDTHGERALVMVMSMRKGRGIREGSDSVRLSAS